MNALSLHSYVTLTTIKNSVKKFSSPLIFFPYTFGTDHLQHAESLEIVDHLHDIIHAIARM